MNSHQRRIDRRKEWKGQQIKLLPHQIEMLKRIKCGSKSFYLPCGAGKA